MNSTKNKSIKYKIKRPKVITITNYNNTSVMNYYLIYSKSYSSSFNTSRLYSKDKLETYDYDKIKNIAEIYRLKIDVNKNVMIESIYNKFYNKEKNLCILNIYLNNNTILSEKETNSSNFLKVNTHHKLIYNRNKIKLYLVEIKNTEKVLFDTTELKKHTKFIINNRKNNTLLIDTFKKNKIYCEEFYIRYKTLMKYIN
jgi:hypothetical protein